MSLAKSLCAHFSLTIGWNLSKLAQIHHQDWGKKWLDLGDLDLFSRSLHYKYSISESCVYSISWINSWNLTILAQIYHWDWGRKWLDFFGDLYLIFKGTPALWSSNVDRKKLVCILYLEPMAGSQPRWLSWMRVWLETRRSQVRPPLRSATFVRGDWSWNIFYGHSLPSADSRRAVVSFWWKNVHNTG